MTFLKARLLLAEFLLLSFLVYPSTLDEKNIWQDFESNDIRLMVNRVAVNQIEVDGKKFELPILSMRIERKAVGPYSKGNWDDISGEVIKGEGETVKITTYGKLAGTEIFEERIIYSKSSITIEIKGQVVSPPGRIEFLRFLGQINVGKGCLPFKATDTEGKIYTGDIYKEFESIKSLSILEMELENHRLKLEFLESARVDLTWCKKAGKPGFPAAYIQIFPAGILPMVVPGIGEKFNCLYRVSITSK